MTGMSAFEKYEYAVNFKTDSFKGHPGYPKFRELVSHALDIRTGFGGDAIAADVITDLILLRTPEEIKAYLDGEKPLKYTKEEQLPGATGKLVRAAYGKICGDTIRGGWNEIRDSR